MRPLKVGDRVSFRWRGGHRQKARILWVGHEHVTVGPFLMGNGEVHLPISLPMSKVQKERSI